MFLLLIVPVFAISEGYPFIGRLINSDMQGIEGVDLQIVFELPSLFGSDICKSKVITTLNGEIVYTYDEDLDFVYEGTNTSCGSTLSSGDEFDIEFLEKVLDCDLDPLGSFILDDSAAYIGTHKVERCEVSRDTSFRVSGGGGGRSSRVRVILPEELQEIIEEYFPNKVIITQELVEEPPREALLKLSQNKTANYLFTLSLIVLLIGNLLWLVSNLKRHMKGK